MKTPYILMFKYSALYFILKNVLPIVIEHLTEIPIPLELRQNISEPVKIFPRIKHTHTHARTHARTQTQTQTHTHTHTHINSHI